MVIKRVGFLCYWLGLSLMFMHFMSVETLGQGSFRGFGLQASSAADSSSDEPQGNAENDEDFDLEACQRYCLGSAAGSNFPATGQVNECVRNCNDRYWKSFDKRMNKIGK